jgi:hypothetical protein
MSKGIEKRASIYSKSWKSNKDFRHLYQLRFEDIRRMYFLPFENTKRPSLFVKFLSDEVRDIPEEDEDDESDYDDVVIKKVPPVELRVLDKN